MQVPRITNPSVESTALPGARQNIVTPTGAFGGTQAQTAQDTGRSLIAAGDQLNKIAVKLQEQDDADMLFQGETGVLTEQIEFQRQIGQRKGADAKGILLESRKWFGETAGKYRQGLTTDRQRKYFDQSMARVRLRLEQWAGDYELEQRNVSSAQTAEMAAQASIDMAAALPNDANLEAARRSIVEKTAVSGQLLGWTPEILAQKNAEGLGVLHQQVLQGLVERDPMQAEAYFELYKPEIPGAMQAEIGKEVRTGTSLVRAQEFAGDMRRSGQSYEDAVNYIRETYQGQEERVFLAEAASVEAERQAARTAAEKAARDTIYNHFANGGTPATVPARAWAALDDYAQDRALGYYERRNKGEAIKTDFSVYSRLLTMARDDPTRFGSYDLTQHRPDLADTDLRTLVEMQAKPSGDPKVLNVISTQKQIELRVNELFPGDLSDESAAERDAAFRRIADSVSAEQQARGKEMTAAEINKHVDGLVLEGVVVRPSAFWGRSAEPAMRYEVLGTPDEAEWQATVPEADAAQIREAYAEELAGMTPEEADAFMPDKYLKLKGVQ